MKRIMVILIAALMVLTIVGCQNTTPADDGNTKELKGAEGWTLQYPENWDKTGDDFIQETSTGKTIVFRTGTGKKDEVEALIDEEIERKLSAEEADNTLEDAVASEDFDGGTVYRYTIKSEGDGTTHLLKTTLYHKDNQWVEFHSSIPPLAEDEYKEIIGSFKF